MAAREIKQKIWRYLHGGKWWLLTMTGRLPSHRLRCALYRFAGMRLGHRATIYGGAEIRRPERIEIGDGSIIGNGAILDGRLGICIGRSVNISTGVWIWTVQHDYRDPYFGDVGGSVVVKDRAWISCRVIILPGVTIGEGAVVGAGSVVTKDVEDFAVVAGVPAKRVGDRPRELNYDLGSGGYIPFI